MPFSIAEIVNDPAFAQNFTITRRSGGAWQLGKWTTSETALTVWGAIQPPTATDLKQVAEADRVTGLIAIWTTQPIYITNVDLTADISDVVTWHGQKYRVLSAKEWQDYGYWKALAVRTSGQ
jgi:hypothetical protein